MGHRSLVLGAASAAAGWTLLAAAPALAAGWHVAPSASPNGYKNQLQAVVRVPGTSQFWAAVDNDALRSMIAVPGTGRLWAVGFSAGGRADLRAVERQRLDGGCTGPAGAGVRLEAVAAGPGTTWAVGSFIPTVVGSGPVGRTLSFRPPGRPRARAAALPASRARVRCPRPRATSG